MSPGATSTQFLNPSRDGDSTTSLGSLVQGLTTVSVKNFFLISNLNLPWCSLRPLLSLHPGYFSCSPAACQPGPAGKRLRGSRRHGLVSPGGTWRLGI